MTTYLTDDEIAYITQPLTQGAARRRYIERVYGIKCRTRPNGQPLVVRAEAEAAGLTARRSAPVATPPAANVITPNFGGLAALKRRQQPPITG